MVYFSLISALSLVSPLLLFFVSFMNTVKTVISVINDDTQNILSNTEKYFLGLHPSRVSMLDLPNTGEVKGVDLILISKILLTMANIMLLLLTIPGLYRMIKIL